MNSFADILWSELTTKQHEHVLDQLTELHDKSFPEDWMTDRKEFSDSFNRYAGAQLICCQNNIMRTKELSRKIQYVTS